MRSVFKWLTGVIVCCHGPCAHSGSSEQSLAPPPADGGFVVRLLLTDDAKAFVGKYEEGWKATVMEGDVHLRRPPHVVGLISGCAVDGRGLCNVTVRYTIFGEDGRAASVKYTRTSDGQRNLDLPVLVNEAPPLAGHWHVRSFGPATGLISNKPDGAGSYLVLAVFTDHNRPDETRTVWRVLQVGESIQGHLK